MDNNLTHHHKTALKLNMPKDLRDDLQRLARERALAIGYDSPGSH